MTDRPGFPPLTADEFDDLVVSTELPVCLYFSCKCCPAANIARREFLIAAQKFKHRIAFFEVNADEEKALASRLNVKGVPILLYLVSGAEQSALLGFYRADELQKQLWSIIPDRS